MTEAINRGDHFTSNNGSGPLLARITGIAQGVAYMERWKNGSTYKTAFTLPVRYLLSPRCGWKKG